MLQKSKPGLCNALALYDAFRPGQLISSVDLARFCLTRLDEFTATCEPDGTQSMFRSCITHSTGDDSSPWCYPLKVNAPLAARRGRVCLVGHGFSPTSPSAPPIVLGLLLSLAVRRRIWLRITPTDRGGADAGTVAVGGLAGADAGSFPSSSPDWPGGSPTPLADRRTNDSKRQRLEPATVTTRASHT